MRRRLLRFSLAAVLGLAVIFALLHTLPVRKIVLRYATGRLEKKLGLEVTVERLGYNLLTLRFELSGLTVRDKDKTELPVFLRAARVTARVPLTTLLKGKLAVKELLASDLRVTVHRSAAGVTNVPDFGSAGTARGPAHSGPMLPEFRVGSLVITGFSVLYADPGRDLVLESPSVIMRLQWAGAKGHAFQIESLKAGTLEFKDGVRLSPSLSARGTLGRDAIELEEFRIETENSQLNVSGRVENPLDPSLDLDLVALIDGETIRPLLSGPPGMSGRVTIKAGLDGPLSSLRADLSLKGELREPARKLEAGFEAEARWADRVLNVPSMRLAVAGGAISGKAELHPLDRGKGNRAQLELDDLDLAGLAALSGWIPPFSSKVSGHIDASWAEPGLKGLSGSAELTFRIPEPQEPGREALWPIRGEVRAESDPERITLVVPGLSSESLSLAGEVRLAGDRISGSYRLETGDLAALCSRYLPSVNDGRFRCLSGAASVSGSIAGTVKAPTATSKWEARGVAVRGSGEWGLVGEASFAGGSIHLQSFRLTSGPAEIRVSGDWALGASRGDSSLDFAATGLPLDRISSLLALKEGIGGTLQFEGRLLGLQPYPRLGVKAKLTGVEYSGWRLEEVLINATAAERLLDFDAAVPTPAISLHGRLGLEPPMGFEASLRMAGVPLSEVLRAVKGMPDADASGALTAGIDINGDARSIASMDVSGFARVEAERVLFRQPLPEVRDLRLEILFDKKALEIKPSSLRFADSLVKVEGRIPLRFFLVGSRPGAGERGPSAVIDVRASDLEFLGLARAFSNALPRGIAGRTNFDLKITASAPNLEGLEARVNLGKLDLELSGITLKLAEPVSLSLSSGKLSLDELALAGEGNHIRIGGAWDLTGAEPPSLHLDGDTDLRALQPFLGRTAISGQSKYGLRVGGTMDDPRITGSVGLDHVGFEMSDPGLYLEGLSGEILLEGGKVVLRGLTGKFNGGNLELGGEVEFKKLALERARLDLTADGVNLGFPENLHSLATARLSFASDGARHRLGGKISLLAAEYKEPFNVESRLFRLLKSKGRSDPFNERSGFLEDLSFDLRFESVAPVRINNNLLDARVQADLRLTGSPYEPGLTGRISVVDGGEVNFGRDTYQIMQASASFVEENRIVPDINLTAQTRKAGYLIELRVIGIPGDLTATLVSEPPLGESDIVSLLLTGQRLEHVSSEILPMVGLQALDYLESALWGRVEQIVERTFGLDTFRIDTSLIASQENPESRITVGRDIARNLEFIFSQGLREAEQRTFILNYRPIVNLKLRAVIQDNNAYQFGVLHDLRFGLRREPVAPALTVRAKGTVIGKIDLAGELGLPRLTVLKTLKLKEGKRFDYFAFRKDIERLAGLYFRNGYLEYDIDYRKEEAAERAALTYRITAGPRVQLIFTGALIPPSTAARARRLWMDGTFAGQRVEDVRKLLATEFYRQGYYRLEIRFEEREVSPEMKTVLIEISPGPRFDAILYAFEGLSGVAEQPLRALLDRPESLLALLTHRAKLTDDMEAVLRRSGHLKARVDDPKIEFRDVEKKVEVTFPVQEGPPYVIGRMTFDGRSRLDRSLLLKASGVAEGGPFRPDLLDLAEAGLERLYKENGFVNSRVDGRAELGPDEGKVDLVFTIKENDKAVIEEVDITGNRITTKGTIARELDFGPGDLVY
ncbi:MAG: translocation/assembly module TamB domain-containing protein, partial [Candidatus Aminicenantales bacterium]